jgi:S1-C subfamily serine protease
MEMSFAKVASISKVLLAGLCAGLLLAASPAAAFDTAKAKEVLKEKGDAVITLDIVLEFKSTYMGQQSESEQQTEEVGFVIDEKGLVATSLANVDPGQFYERMQMMEDYTFTSTVKSIKYVLAGGREIDAAVVLRDPDQDLAFLRPLEAPAEPMTYIPLDNSVRGEIFDPIFSIERSGRITRRTIIGKAGTVTGIVERPRRFYLPSSELSSNRTGSPVFSDGGALLGMLAVYTFPGGARARSDSEQPYAFIIIPAEDVLRVAEQAPAEADPSMIPQADEPEEAEEAEEAEEGTEEE